MATGMTVAAASSPVPGQPEPYPANPSLDGSESDWAQVELMLAIQNGLAYPGVTADFHLPITREEFSTVAVRLWEKLTGRTAEAGVNPFTDTTSPEVVKAYWLGIVRGTSATEFNPERHITRQELCVMVFRTLKAAGKDTQLTVGGLLPFADAVEVAPWALAEVHFCHQKGIIKGTSATAISPLLSTPREQAIILVLRAYEAVK